jgi:hypothetical protein
MSRNIWTYLRSATFYIVGFMNTFLIRPEHLWTWRHFFGIFFLILAIVETIYILRRILKQNPNSGV